MKQTLCGMVLLVLVCSSASAATFTPLGDLAGGGFNSGANGVSADGSVVVGVSDSASGTEAFRWTGGVMTGLGDLPLGGFNSSANGVSADGSVVVGAGRREGTPPFLVPYSTEAFRWTGGVMAGLGDLFGGFFASGAVDVSADGSVVVGVSDSAFGTEAFRWTGGVMTGLGFLAGGVPQSFANGVSANGLRVVGDGGTGAGTEAFIWEPTAGGMQRLFDVLIAQGATGLTGWTLQRATGISDDGNTIVGTGINPLGFTEGFVAVIPVPPAVWLFGSALGVMGWMRRNAA